MNLANLDWMAYLVNLVTSVCKDLLDSPASSATWDHLEDLAWTAPKEIMDRKVGNFIYIFYPFHIR